MGFFDQFRNQEPLDPAREEPGVPVRIVGNAIHVDSKALQAWQQTENHPPRYEYPDVMELTEAEPVIELYEDGAKTREYRLEIEDGENFAGKFFHIGIMLGYVGIPPFWVAQIDGFVSDTAEKHEMTRDEIGFRMEGHFLSMSGDLARERYEAARGQDLVAKGLKYPGMTTSSNVRLIGICADCGKSFAFHGYAVYMAQDDVAYSDDGLDVCAIAAYDIDPDTWSYEADGKVYRYYNSFRCPHCGAAYIDYENNHDMKRFGVSACTLIGHKIVHV